MVLFKRIKNGIIRHSHGHNRGVTAEDDDSRLDGTLQAHQT